jgi:hypothetical protein
VDRLEAEPVYVAKCWDDLRFAEKDNSELEIAGFLRNIFKYSAVNLKNIVMVRFNKQGCVTAS